MPDVPERPYLQTSDQWTSFVSAFLHELRTPLGSLSMLAELLDDSRPGGPGERERRYTSNIREVVRDILALVGDVGELARLLAGRAALRLEEVDLAGLVGELEETFRPQAWDRGIGFAISLDPATLPPFRTDRDRLRQLFLLLFEARSRYLYLYLPFFFVLASVTVVAVVKVVGARPRRRGPTIRS